MDEDLYCKVYVDSSNESSDFLAFIAKVVKGNISLRTVENDLLEITVFKNEDYEKDKTTDVDGFVFFPYYLEIEPVDESSVSSEEYKSLIGDLLEALWAKGADAVAACDFEDKPPKKLTLQLLSLLFQDITKTRTLPNGIIKCNVSVW